MMMWLTALLRHLFILLRKISSKGSGASDPVRPLPESKSIVFFLLAEVIVYQARLLDCLDDFKGPNLVESGHAALDVILRLLAIQFFIG